MQHAARGSAAGCGDGTGCLSGVIAGLQADTTREARLQNLWGGGVQLPGGSGQLYNLLEHARR